MFCSKRNSGFVQVFVLVVAVIELAVGWSSTATAQNNTSIFGPNVYIFSPSTSPAVISATLNILNQETQFSTNRYAVLFMPGTDGIPGDYGTSSNPLTAQVGFYEQISGLGESPDDVQITGGFYADQLIDGNMTQNFWRSQENMGISPSGGLTPGVLDWGVSQGASLRRMDIAGGLTLTNSQAIGSVNACAESSGGFIADTNVSGLVNACSQQQWYTRNSDLAGGFSGNVWNFVFSGDIPANVPAQSYPGGSAGDVNVTNLTNTPVSEEKPFLYVDNSGNFNVFVPALKTNSSGTSWSGGGLGWGSSMPISSFLIASPSTSLTTINNALASGQSLILTPGIYQYSGPIHVTNANTVVLGMGYATLVPQTGTPALVVADVDNVHIAGLLIDAGPVTSAMLLEVGNPGIVNNSHPVNPTVLSDVFFRIGGATAGSAVTSLQVDSGDVILDNIWAWRADHGNPGTVGWTVNTAAHGVVVNGSNVTALGLAVEHYQQEQVLWNGDKGETIFYQSELPYDPPNQAAWSNGTSNGYPSYAVTPGSVCTHTAYGLGIYSYFDLGVNIVDDNAMTVPGSTGVQINDVGTVFLNGSGQISNIINGTGGPASTANSGKLNPLASYQGTDLCAAPTEDPGDLNFGAPLTNPNPNNYLAANIMQEIENPHTDLTLVVAHRGLHALVNGEYAGVPENSLQSIGLAAQAGIEMVEVDLKLTGDTPNGIPILSHDENWGRETCTYWFSTGDGVPFDPFQAQGSNPTNDAKNPAVSSVTKDRMRWYYLDNTVLRDSISLTYGNNGFYAHGCSVTGHSLFAGEFAPTLQEVLDYMTYNKIAMVLTLDIKDPATASAAWQVVNDTKDYLGNSYAQTTLFKIAARNFTSPTSMINTIFSYGAGPFAVHLFPYFGTANIKPGVFPVSPGGGDAAVSSMIRYYELSGLDIAAVEVDMKENGGILSTALDPARTNALTEEPERVGVFSPYVEYWDPADTNHTTPKFFSKYGYCCETLADYFYNAPGSANYDPTQPSDTADNRGNLESFVIPNDFNIVTTDDAFDVAGQFKAIGLRNIEYLQAGYNGTGVTGTGGPANGIYTIVNVNSSLTIDVPGGSTSPGVEIEQWTPNGGAGQQWAITSLNNGYYQIVNVKSGLCLDVVGGSTQTGAKIDQYTCYPSYGNQQFAISSSGAGTYTIVGEQSGLAVEIPGFSTAAGTLLDQDTNNQSANQEWTLHLAGPPTGTYTITNANSGLVMDVAGNSKSTGAAIDQWTSNGQSNQKWTLTYLASGMFQLTSVNSGLCLDVSGGSTQNGGTLDQYTCYPTYGNQQFTISPSSGGNYTIVNNQSGLAVEVPGLSTTPGTVLDQWTVNGGANQVWTFTPTTP